jgi:hypothetical protein
MKKIAILTAIAAISLLATSCTTFVAAGAFIPQSNALTDLVDAPVWTQLEFGGIVDKPTKPVLVRFAAGYTGATETDTLTMTDITLFYLTLRLSAMYMLMPSPVNPDAGVYAGIGLTNFLWAATIDSGGITADDSGSESGFHIIGGYKHDFASGTTSLLVEFIIDMVRNSETDDPMGGISFMVGLGF